MIPSNRHATVAGLLVTIFIGVQAQVLEAAQPSADLQRRDHQHQHDFPATINEFHHALAQLWHAQPGPERARAVCDRASQLRTLADNVKDAPLPQSAHDDNDGWTRAVKNMVESVDQLMAMCSGPNSAESERALGRIHQAFYGVAAYLGHRH
ncbi:MAG: hypothetical protein R3268_07975 [Acidiferrobacterales bacterium]|nr:hypothetical protein [Acidiferrobacterales bacterium]